MGPQPSPVLPADSKRYLAWIALTVAFLLLLLFTNTLPVGGDTAMYSADINNSLQRDWADPEIWNFAHLIWRPLGRALSLAFLDRILYQFGNNRTMGISFLLMCPNILAALICGLVVQRAVWKLTESQIASLVAGVAVLCVNFVLNFSRQGTPYLCGLACASMALYLAAFANGSSWRTAAAAGALAGLAMLFWVPYVASLPAILLAGPILNVRGGRPRFNIRFAINFSVAAALVVGLLYLVALDLLRIHTVSGFFAWLHESASDYRDRKLLRMVNGVARGIWEMGDDSVWLKWFLFRDPYAKVTLWDLVRASFAKLAMFYISMAGLLLLLARSSAGRRLLWVVAIATLPHLAIAAAYESGSVERYAPFLPTVFIAFGYLIGSTSLPASTRAIAAILCAAHIVPNLVASETRSLDRTLHSDPVRLSVMTSLPATDRMFVINNRDSLFRLDYGDPLNPLHRNPMPSVHALLGGVGSRIELWREDFACEVISVWNRNGDAWMTKRVEHTAPIRSWLWVEGDSAGITWPAIHQFFLQFDRSVQVGGEDGFFQVRKTPLTRGLLLSNIAGGDAKHCFFAVGDPAPGPVP